MTRQQHPLAIGELVYDVAPWKIYRQDSGMGEHDYGVFRYGEFFCRTDNRNDSDEVIRCINHCTGDDLITRRSRSRSPAAPVPEGTSKLCFGTIDLRWDSCQACNEIETCQQKQRYLDFDKQQAAAEEREKVLNEIEQYLCSCVWSNAPDCPGQSNGECICDGCERFEYPFPEDAREYIKSLRREGEQHG